MTVLPPPAALPVPAYHAGLREYFTSAEPELWAWFADTYTRTSTEATDSIELELLKSAYRIDVNDGLTLSSDAVLIAARLGLDCPVTCYQALNTEQSNATIHILGDATAGFEVRIVFSGELLSLLTNGELRAVLAHELAHAELLLREGGDYRILEALVERMASISNAPDALDETARRLRLHTEVHADAVSIAATGDRNDLIAALVKTQSGLKNVDPLAYLRQAEQILLSDAAATAAWTHPELHIRVACISTRSSSPASRGPGAGNTHDVLTRLIEGPDDLDRLDLPGQLRLQDLTSSVLAGGVEATADWTRYTSYLDSFLGNKGIEELLASVGQSAGPLRSAKPTRSFRPVDDGLAGAQPSIRTFAAALLVDLAMSHDPQRDNLGPLELLSKEAERIGVATEFDRILSKATGQTLRDVRQIRI